MTGINMPSLSPLAVLCQTIPVLVQATHLRFGWIRNTLADATPHLNSYAELGLTVAQNSLIHTLIIPLFCY